MDLNFYEGVEHVGIIGYVKIHLLTSLPLGDVIKSRDQKITFFYF